MIEQSVEEYLNKLEQIITLAKKSFIGDYKMVDEGACIECISDIRKLLPSELSEARLIRKDAQNIVAKAQKDAQDIIAKAQAEAQRLVSENKIIEDAQNEAQKIVDQASEYANGMVGQAYSDLARLYHCINGTKDINKAVKRNIDRFPEDFYFQLTQDEHNSLKFQIGTSKTRGV